MTAVTTQQDFQNNNTQSQLKTIVTRIERLEEEKKALSEDISEVYAESKGNGFDPKVIKQLVRLRAKDPSEVQEEAELLDLYKMALGMV